MTRYFDAKKIARQGHFLWTVNRSTESPIPSVGPNEVVVGIVYSLDGDTIHAVAPLLGKKETFDYFANQDPTVLRMNLYRISSKQAQRIHDAPAVEIAKLKIA